MAKIYIMLLNKKSVPKGCILDLDKLPFGAHSNKVDHPWNQGVELTKLVVSDIEQTEQLIFNISNNCIDEETINFITSIASFWENLPPADEEKDGVIAVRAGSEEGDFIRTSPEVANEMWTEFSKLR